MTYISIPGFGAPHKARPQRLDPGQRLKNGPVGVGNVKVDFGHRCMDHVIALVGDARAVQDHVEKLGAAMNAAPDQKFAVRIRVELSKASVFQRVAPFPNGLLAASTLFSLFGQFCGGLNGGKPGNLPCVFRIMWYTIIGTACTPIVHQMRS